METSVSQRIKFFLKEQRLSVNQLSKLLNLKQNTLNGQLNGTANLSINTITPLLEAFPDLSAEWLLRGTGPMERTEAEPDQELKAICIEQTREIYRLRQRLDELEGQKKDLA